MTVETTSAQAFVTWTTSAADPCVLLWRRTRPRARWQVFEPRCDTPQEASELAHHYAMTNFIPAEDPAAERRGAV